MQKLLYGIGGFIALLLLVGFFLPRESRFAVQAHIDASPATVFSLANDLRRLRLWAPASAEDPNVRIEFSGPARGSGASVSWDGPIAGSGTQTITESTPYSSIGYLINAGESGESRSRMEFAGGLGATEVRWEFSHDYGYNLIGRYFGLVVNGILRRDYERGLTDLKLLAESLPVADFSDLEVERLQVEPQLIAFKSTRSKPDAASMSEALGSAYFEIQNFIDGQQLQLAGPPLSISRSFSGAELVFDAGIPVAGVTEETPRNTVGVRLGQTYGGPVLRVRHVGAYRDIPTTQRKLASYLAALDIARAGDAWEVYVSDPGQVPEAQLLTWLYYPVDDTP